MVPNGPVSSPTWKEMSKSPLAKKEAKLNEASGNSISMSTISSLVSLMLNGQLQSMPFSTKNELHVSGLKLSNKLLITAHKSV